MVREHAVIVVGAGLAGLACAQRLTDASVDFLGLEAADRIGGRALTDHSLAAAPLELGALMIHGKRVVTHAWLSELGLRARRYPVFQKGRFLRNGRVARYPTMLLPFHPTFGPRAFYQGAVGVPRAMKRYGGPDLSLPEFLERVRALPGAREIVTLLRAHAANADPEETGVRGHAEEDRLAKEEFGYTNFQILEGYSELVGRRASPFQDRIRLNARVVAVRRGPNGVRLDVVEDGEVVEYRAKRAVITLPLGVLKAEAVAFDPPLPETKKEAIRAIGFGAAMTVLIRLRGGNLVKRLGDFALLWGSTASTFHRPFVGLDNRPEVITAFVVGREARIRATMGDQEVVDSTLAELARILPSRAEAGTAEAWRIARWPTDPLIRGGYTFLPVNAGVAHRRDLAAPVDGVLFFAGEATHTEGEPATAHGAIETGYRAAGEVLDSLKASVPKPA